MHFDLCGDALFSQYFDNMQAGHQLKQACSPVVLCNSETCLMSACHYTLRCMCLNSWWSFLASSLHWNRYSALTACWSDTQILASPVIKDYLLLCCTHIAPSASDTAISTRTCLHFSLHALTLGVCQEECQQVQVLLAIALVVGSTCI